MFPLQNLARKGLSIFLRFLVTIQHVNRISYLCNQPRFQKQISWAEHDILHVRCSAENKSMTSFNLPVIVIRV